MPHARSDRNRGQQRRVFRGSGGPTDGNLPPKKNSRPKVKYCHRPEEEAEEEEEEEGGCGQSQYPEGGRDDDGFRRRRRRTGENDDDDEDDDIFGEGDGRNDERARENNRSTSGESDDVVHASEEEEEQVVLPQNEKLAKELRHLERRIRNVRESLQTSRGLSNPEVWRTNCLLPVRNVVREWRSVATYHRRAASDDDVRDEIDADGIGDGVSVANDGDDDDANDDANNDANDGDDDDENDHQSVLLRSTSQRVFGLIQMAMQSGPLVGSNPGYFKRCGGDVASMAFDFLDEILDLARQRRRSDREIIATTEWREEGATGEDGGDDGDDNVLRDGRGRSGETNPRAVVASVQCRGTTDEEIERRMDGCDLSRDDDSSQLCDDSASDGGPPSGSEREEDVFAVADGPIRVRATDATPKETDDRARAAIRDDLRGTFLFTETQSARYARWHRDAETAAEKNKAPSASAGKLQAQKSKKQKQKELKAERKSKKKKKKKGGR